MSIKFEYSDAYYNFGAADEVLPFLFQRLQIKSVIDIGCGTGTWLKIAEDFGIIDIMGIDGASSAKSQLKIKQEQFLEKDLRVPFSMSRTYDLVICLEVAEHLPASSAHGLIESLCRHGDIVLFSAAIPGQEGQDHINEQWPQYWAAIFQQFGYTCYDVLRPYFWENEKVDLWYRQNMFLYSNRDIAGLFKMETNIALPLVHPEMFRIKLKEIQSLKENIEHIRNQQPGVRKAYRMFRTALIRKFF